MPGTMHGRTEEMAELRQLAGVAASGRPQLVVLYGRRRTGKTFLLRRFLETLPSLNAAYHACSYLSPVEELRQALQSPAVAARLSGKAGGSVDELLTQLGQAAQDELLVVVLDEFPYLIRSDDRIAAAFQRFWDSLVESGAKLLLILTGSAISTMTSVVSSEGPLFMRPTKLIKLDPFDFPTTASFLGVTSASPFEAQRSVLEARAACGGYPLLLERWDVTQTAAVNLQRLGARPLDPLITMSSVLLLDLPDARGVRSVLTAIGRGVHKYAEIQARTDQRVDAALMTLSSGGYISAVVPIGSKEEKGTRKLYRIADDHLLFYFSIVDPYRQLFEASQGSAVLDGSVERWNALVQAAFERDCRAHAVSLVRAGDLPSGTLVGEWWVDKPEQAQVDVVGIDPLSRDWRFAGEVKWVSTFGPDKLRRFEESVRIAGPQGARAAKIIWVPQDGAVAFPRSAVRVETLSHLCSPESFR
jgi:uncharacterized protein